MTTTTTLHTRYGLPASSLEELSQLQGAVEYRTADGRWVPGRVIGRPRWSEPHQAWYVPVWNPVTNFVAAITHLDNVREA